MAIETGAWRSPAWSLKQKRIIFSGKLPIMDQRLGSLSALIVARAADAGTSAGRDGRVFQRSPLVKQAVDQTK
jgi:hypothetical protein